MTNLEKLKTAVITPFPSLCLLENSQYRYVCAEVIDGKLKNKKCVVRASLKDDYGTMIDALIKEIRKLNLYPCGNIHSGWLFIRIGTIFVRSNIIFGAPEERIVADTLRASLQGNQILCVAINNRYFPKEIQKILESFSRAIKASKKQAKKPKK